MTNLIRSIKRGLLYLTLPALIGCSTNNYFVGTKYEDPIYFNSNDKVLVITDDPERESQDTAYISNPEDYVLIEERKLDDVNDLTYLADNGGDAMSYWRWKFEHSPYRSSLGWDSDGDGIINADDPWPYRWGPFVDADGNGLVTFSDWQVGGHTNPFWDYYMFDHHNRWFGLTISPWRTYSPWNSWNYNYYNDWAGGHWHTPKKLSPFNYIPNYNYSPRPNNSTTVKRNTNLERKVERTRPVTTEKRRTTGTRNYTRPVVRTESKYNNTKRAITTSKSNRRTTPTTKSRTPTYKKMAPVQKRSNSRSYKAPTKSRSTSQSYNNSSSQRRSTSTYNRSSSPSYKNSSGSSSRSSNSSSKSSGTSSKSSSSSSRSRTSSLGRR